MSRTFSTTWPSCWTSIVPLPAVGARTWSALSCTYSHDPYTSTRGGVSVSAEAGPSIGDERVDHRGVVHAHHSARAVTGVDVEDLTAHAVRGGAVQEHQRRGLLLGRLRVALHRRLEQQVAEHLPPGRGVHQGRRGGPRAGGVDADAAVAQRHRLPLHVHVDGLLREHVVRGCHLLGLLRRPRCVLLTPTSRARVVRSVEELEHAAEDLLP